LNPLSVFDAVARDLGPGFRLGSGVLVALALAVATPAHAAAPKKSEKVGQYVDLQAVAIPVVRQGRLVNYVFVQARLNLTDKGDPMVLRPKAPYFRDALVKAAHRQSLVDPQDPTRIDEAVFVAVLSREAAKVAGPGLVAGAEIVHQSSKRRRF
jgi:hypothetical protein